MSAEVRHFIGFGVASLFHENDVNMTLEGRPSLPAVLHPYYTRAPGPCIAP
jgi:hypothetical protein